MYMLLSRILRFSFRGLVSVANDSLSSTENDGCDLHWQSVKFRFHLHFPFYYPLISDIYINAWPLQ